MDNTLTNREQETLEFCDAPRTVEEIAEHFNTGYFTARNTVKALVRLGLITQLSWPKPGTRKLQYQTTWETKNGKPSELAYSYGNRRMTLHDITCLGSDENQQVLIEELYGLSTCITYLLRRAELREKGYDEDQLPFGSEELSRREMITIRDRFYNLAMLCDQLVNSQIWNGKINKMTPMNTENDETSNQHVKYWTQRLIDKYGE